jgi:murein L,D-transpeptidase YafK
LALDDCVDIRILIDRQSRRLRLQSGNQIERDYPIVIGRNAGTDKEVEGDLATPSGEFYICAKNPRSKFFLSLCLSYPNIEDAQRGLSAGLIGAEEHRQILDAINQRQMPPQQTRLGGEIYIHGQAPTGPVPWTRGCVALDNPAMQEIYDRVAMGTVVRID